ncbi:MAG TPA: L,D-transpeptidase family protein [Solirubrobacteraceae bacterium]
MAALALAALAAALVSPRPALAVVVSRSPGSAAALVSPSPASAAALASARSALAAPATPRVLYKRLSDLRTLSHWAYTATESPVRSTPSSRAPTIGQLRFFTIDEQAELYIVLASARLRSGATWLRIELPGRPNGHTGWVPRAALGPLNAIRGYLLVDRTNLHATLFRDGRAIFTAPVGVGKASTVTPSGHFYVMEKLRAVGSPIYGPYALGTSAYAPTLSEWPGGGVVGIHGTDEPSLIPGRPSHGCIRMRNEDISRLWAMIALGTPIEII